MHFILEVPFYNSLISFMEKLFNVPNKDFSSCIPLIKPVLNSFAILIFWTPAFRINHIFCKNIIYSQILLFQPHIKP